MAGSSELERGKSRASLVRTAPPFVGRRQELDWLEHQLQEAIAGRPRVVLMPGEAGIGKTRLLDQLRSAALRRGVQVGYGRCYEDLSLPYLSFIEALRPQLEPVPEDVGRTLGADAEIISRFLSQAGGPTPPSGPSMSLQADQDKLRLFLAVSRATMTLAQRCPTLFVMDDLHWADRSSLDLFGHLVFAVADTAVREPVPLLIIGTYRPVEPEERLARLIARFQREEICQTLELPGLSETEIHELIQGLGLEHPSHQLTATLSEATQGNPLFIQEVLHHLMQQDALQERGGYLVTTFSPSDLPLPKQVTSALVAHTQGLSEGCQRVLTLASLLGDRFGLQTLAAVSDMGENEVVSLLEEGMRQHLLLSEDQSFQFAHPLIRHVFYHEPSAGRRQRIHRQIAQTLERLYADSLDAHILELAHHLIRAGPAVEVEKVVAYARRAGDQACRVFAWGEAAQYYEAALRAAEATGRLSAHERAELHYSAGLARFRDNDAGPCLDQYEKAIAAYRLAGDLPGLGQALMERTRTQFTLAAVPYGTLIDMQPLEDVLEALGDNEPGLRGSMAAVMAEVYWTARQTAKAKEMAQRGLEIGACLKDDRLCAYASFALGVAQAQALHVREALESWRNGLVYARQAGDLWLEGLPLQRIPVALTCLGRLNEAEAVALEACELTRKIQDWGYYSVPLSHLASLAVARGDFAVAERRAHETMLMVHRSGYPWGGARSLLALACARALRGAWAEAQEALDMLVAPGGVFKEAGPVIQVFARTFRQLLRAQSEAVDEAIEPLVADLMRAMITDTNSLPPFCALVELGDLLAAPAMAEHPYQALSLAAERGVLFSHGWVFLIPRVLGVAATLNRWWDKADAHFQVAIEVATRAGARPELGRAYLDYARMLAARGGRNARRRAGELVRQAGPIFDELGMEPFARRAAQLAEALHARMPPVPQPRAPHPDQLSEQEVKVLLQMVQGRTNQEIADDLVLRSKTVAGHVRSIFSKIGVKSRKAAAAYAFEQGLASQLPPQRGTEITAALDRVGTGEAPRTDAPLSLPQPLHIILVTDMEGSTALIQRWGDAKAYELVGLHNAIIRDCLRRYHGAEVTHTGDGIEASFVSASNAIECAVAIQQAFAKHNQEHPASPIRVRIGVNAGEPILTEGRLFGTAVHTAFRICTRAQPGQILVSEVIRHLAVGTGFVFANRGRVALKGLPGRFHLYEVQWEGDPK